MASWMSSYAWYPSRPPCIGYAENPRKNKLNGARDFHNVSHIEIPFPIGHDSRRIEHQLLFAPVHDFEFHTGYGKIYYSYSAGKAYE